jgi:tripartite-type tricarboxylate transporter receptor subunit TctC
MKAGKLFKSLPRYAGAALLVLPLSVSAQSNYPNKPIRFVVGFAAGGSTDVIARMLGRRMSEILGQPIVTDNRPGADSLIATQQVAQAEPDGYTILVASGSHSINPSVYPDSKLDPVKDFTPISLLTDGPNFLVVHPSVPVQNVKELLALARKNPGKLNYASSASTTFLQTELFKSMAGVNITSIPYKGAAPAVLALIAGEADVQITGIINIINHVKAGKARALAVTSAQRYSLVPDVPTVSESGVPGYTSSVWYGMLAPARIPPTVVQLLSTTSHKVMQEPAIRTQLLSLGQEVMLNTPEEFVRFIQEDGEKWAKVVRESGVK